METTQIQFNVQCKDVKNFTLHDKKNESAKFTENNKSSCIHSYTTWRPQTAFAGRLLAKPQACRHIREIRHMLKPDIVIATKFDSAPSANVSLKLDSLSEMETASYMEMNHGRRIWYLAVTSLLQIIILLQCFKRVIKYRVFKKELYNGILNVTVWRELRKRLRLKAYKLSIVQYLERWIICTPLSTNVFVKLHIVTFGVLL
jgi:hypothetical protein